MKANAKYLAVFFSAILFLPLASAVLSEGTMKIFAVTTDGKGLSADLHLKIVKGSGRVWVDVEPLVGTSTQSTALIASQIAKNYSGDVSKYDYFFDINSDASVVEGPSAGAAMALLLISMLKEKKVPSDVGITGTITEEGYIGAVGGIFEKSKEAARSGIKLFMIPKGEAKQTVKDEGEIKSINLVDYAPENLGMKVVEVSNIDEALKYAFTDIGKIDVNSSTNALPDFIPEGISTPEYLSRMRTLTLKYLADSKHSLSEAKTALSTTLIDDSSLLSSLLEVLNESEESIKQAEILYDKNYLYSAANYAFVGKVNSMFVKDIANNPSIIEPNSTAFDLKLLSLKRDITDLRESFSDKLFIGGIEWQAAALQRLNWAQQNYDSIKEKSTVVVVTYDGQDVDKENVIKDIHNYEFAVAWVQASRDFYDVAKDSGKQVDIKIKDLSSLKSAVEKYLVETEDLALIVPLEEDTLRRLASARYALENNDYLTAIYDSASAYALENSLVAVQEKNISELNKLLQNSLSDANKALEGKEYVWSRLYLDHSRYFQEAAIFYDKQELGSRHKDSLENGISLAMLSKELSIATDKINESVSAKISEKQIDVGLADAEPIFANAGNIDLILLLMLLLLFLLLVFLLLMIISLLRKRSSDNLLSKIDMLREHEMQLRKKHDEGKISDEDFAYQLASVSNELCRLESLRKEKAEHLLRAEKLKYEIKAVEKELSELNKLYSKGMITQEEFNEKVLAINKKLSGMKLGMSKEEEVLKKEDSKIKETLSRAKNAGKKKKPKPKLRGKK